MVIFQDSNEEELVPCIKNKSIRQTVQTMARFMAAYFSNEPMFIFPPHSAQALPSIHMNSQPTSKYCQCVNKTDIRFMAAYFSNEPMFIFPPHSAQALPSIHMNSQPTSKYCQ